jgi:DNA-directed RNA polymerase subunit RPC12/RpoP
VKLGLPVVLHVNNAASLLRAIEILRGDGLLANSDEDQEDEEATGLKVLLHDAVTCCDSKVEHVRTAVEAGMYFLVAATGITDAGDQFAEAHQRAQACVAQIPLARLLLCTDSPWKTPQNLPDPYLRTLRNEPSNIASIAVALSEALYTDVKELSATIRTNTMAVFGLGSDGSAKEAAPTEHAAKSDASAPKKSHKPASQSAKAATSKAYYSCVRCRARLFQAADQKTHSMSTAKTVFKVGEEGLCASTLMFRPTEKEGEHNDGGSSAGGGGGKAVTLRGNSVECAECGSKLGKFSTGEALCGCGAVVEGRPRYVHGVVVVVVVAGDLMLAVNA